MAPDHFADEIQLLPPTCPRSQTSPIGRIPASNCDAVQCWSSAVPTDSWRDLWDVSASTWREILLVLKSWVKRWPSDPYLVLKQICDTFKMLPQIVKLIKEFLSLLSRQSQIQWACDWSRWISRPITWPMSGSISSVQVCFQIHGKITNPCIKQPVYFHLFSHFEMWSAAIAPSYISTPHTIMKIMS